MLTLCPAIQAIYQNELKYGNRISVVSNFSHKKDATATLVVYMVKPLGQYDTKKRWIRRTHTIEEKEYTGTHVCAERYFFCRDCGCVVSGPLSSQQGAFYTNENHLIPDERVIATRDNVYWRDEDWGAYLVPVLFTDPIEST